MDKVEAHCITIDYKQMLSVRSLEIESYDIELPDLLVNTLTASSKTQTHEIITGICEQKVSFENGIMYLRRPRSPTACHLNTGGGQGET